MLRTALAQVGRALGPEEIAWRGYAFRRIREGRSFGAAMAAATCVPLAYLSSSDG